MTQHRSSTKTPGLAAHAIIVAVAICAFALTPGCGPKQPAPVEKPTLVSYDNLQTAYAVSLRRARMYELFIPRASKEKYRGMAALYQALRSSEQVHGKVHESLLRKLAIEPAPVKYDSIVVGTTLQTLKMALSSEELEFQTMYPNLARTAELEQFADGLDQFTRITAVEERHVQLLKEADSRSGQVGTTYFVCPACGYILTSRGTEECPVCKSPRASFVRPS